MKNFALQKRVPLMLAVAGLALAIAPCTRADSYTENMSFVGGGLSCSPACTGPYATMEVDLTSATTAVLTFTALTDDGTYQYLIGDDSQAVALNVNATSATVSGITATQLGGFTPIAYSPDYYFSSPQGYDSLGYYNLNIDGTGAGYSTAATEISFTLTDTGGTWGSAYDVLTNNGNGYHHDAAIPVYVCPEGSCDATNEITHGTVGASQVPEPASIVLLGTLLVALAGCTRRLLSTR